MYDLRYLLATTFGISSFYIMKYIYSIVNKEENLDYLYMKIKNLEDEVNELHEIIDNLEDKVNHLENTLHVKEMESIDLHKSNIDLNNKLNNFITYNYEVL